MSDALLSLFLGIGVTGWGYSQLAKRNGNAAPSNNLLAAAVGGVVVAIIFFTLLKFVLHIG